jgi:hypothetical protein
MQALFHQRLFSLGFWLIAATLFAATTTGARTQAPAATDDEVKVLRCRQNTSELIFMNREQLRAKCGLWSKSYTVKTAEGEVERIVYSRYFVLTLRKGQVSSVRQRRQIFTGFKKN